MTITMIRMDSKHEFWEQDPRALTARLLTWPMNLQYWSHDALRELVVGTCQVVARWCVARLGENPPEELMGKYKRYAAWATRTAKNFPRQNQQRALVYIYNVAMAAEGKGLLSGFGIINRHSDRPYGNAEKQSLWQDDYTGV